MTELVDKLKSLASDRRIQVLAVIGFGVWLRLLHLVVQGVTAPYAGGGLYVEFAHQIAANGFHLPIHIPFYSDGGIPYAYPPLPFYLNAVLISLLPIPVTVISNLVPPLVAIVTLPSFYLLSVALGLPYRTRIMALVAFATMPGAFLEQIGGAGLAESWGTLAVIWFAIALAKAYQNHTVKLHVLTGLAWAFCVVASPGSAYASMPMFAIYAGSVFVRKKGRGSVGRNAGLLVLAGAVALVASSPYWLTVISNHGSGVLLNAFSAQHGSIRDFVLDIVEGVFEFEAAQGRFHFVWDAVIFAGLLGAFLRGRLALVAWFLAFLVIPREGVWLVSVPGCILAGFGVTEMFAPWVRSAADGRHTPLLRATVVTLFGAYIALNPVFEIRRHTWQHRQWDWQAEREGMDWVRAYLPDDALLVSYASVGLTDWLPHFTRRTVLNAIQGTEWKPTVRPILKRLVRKQLPRCEDLSCIQRRVEQATGHGDFYLFAHRDKLPDPAITSANHPVLWEPLWSNEVIIVGRLAPTHPPDHMSSQ